MLADDIRDALVAWANCNSIVRQLYIFGSQAKGTASATSDLDIALVLDEAHGNELSGLVVHRAAWKSELTKITGIFVKDIELANELDTVAYHAVRDHGILLFDRDVQQAASSRATTEIQ